MALNKLKKWIGTQAMTAFFDQLNDNVDATNDHMAESASKHITESGSNANGRYVKFDDGTMICYFTVPCSYDNSIRLLGVWTFPASFIANPIVAATKAYSTSIVRLINTSPHVSNNSTTNVTISLLQIVNADGSAMVDSWSSGDVYGASCIAIGRWK